MIILLGNFVNFLYNVHSEHFSSSLQVVFFYSSEFILRAADVMCGFYFRIVKLLACLKIVQNLCSLQYSLKSPMSHASVPYIIYCYFSRTCYLFNC